MRVLILERHARVERQDLGCGRVMLAQRFGGFADFALARQEHQDIAARRDARELVDRVDDGLFKVFIVIAAVVAIVVLAGPADDSGPPPDSRRPETSTTGAGLPP